MPRKHGAPAPGTSRQLTVGEASALGCSAKWWVRVGSDGVVTLLFPKHKTLWTVGPKFTAAQMKRVADTLKSYWTRGRGTFISGETLERVRGVARAALRDGMTRAVRAELEWQASLGEECGE